MDTALEVLALRVEMDELGLLLASAYTELVTSGAENNTDHPLYKAWKALDEKEDTLWDKLTELEYQLDVELDEEYAKED